MSGQDHHRRSGNFAAAKVVKEFAENAGKPKIRFGFVGEERLEADAVLRIADLPSIEVLRSQLLGVTDAGHPVGPRRQYPSQHGGPGHPSPRG